MAPKKDEAEQEWQDYAADVVQAIIDGDLDFALKDIIKNAVQRAKDANLVPPTMRQAMEGKTALKGGTKDEGKFVTDAKGKKYPLLEHAIKPYTRDEAAADDQHEYFEFDGLCYRRKDFVNHAIRVPYDSNHSWAGKIVVVGGAGPEKIMIFPASESDKGTMTLPLGGEKGFIGKKHLSSYFGRS